MVNEKGEPQYDKLLSGDIADIEQNLKHFVIYKKKKGVGAAGIENYINILITFYKAHGLKKKIDWELIQTYLQDDVKKTKDREYYDTEVWAIEDKCGERVALYNGTVQSGFVEESQKIANGVSLGSPV
jgi:hypothetical protein